MHKKLYFTGIIVSLLLSQNLFANFVIYVNRNHPQFTIKLASNKTTGYSWSVTYDKNSLSLINHKYIAPNSHLIGAPGYEQWIFQSNPQFINKAKATPLTFVYARPWEQNKSIKTISYKVRVKD